LRLDRETIIATSFILLSIGSAVYMTSITLNYLNYYPALAQLSAQIDSTSVVRGSNSSMIDTRITVSNPSAYSGFKPAEADVSMSLQVNNSSARLFSGNNQLDTIQTISVQLGPHSSFETDVVTELSPENSASLGQFVSQNQGSVMANVTLTVYMITFLTPVVGRTPIMTSSYLSLSTV
jgi:hypothetical protein